MGTPAFSPVVTDHRDGPIYKVAFFDRFGAIPNPDRDDSIHEDLQVVDFQMTPTGPLVIAGPDNISNTPQIDDTGPTWSPDGTEIASRALILERDAEGNDVSSRDLLIYPVDGSTGPISVLQGPGRFPELDSVGGPDWARTHDDMLIVGLALADGDDDIWCIELDPITRESVREVNLTQPLDDSDGEINDKSPVWLPGDEGILIDRDDRLIEIRFNGYSPADGCPTDPGDATVRSLGKRIGDLGHIDYLRVERP